MSRLVTYLLFLVVAVSAVAQFNVIGNVIDKESNEPLVGASVIVKGSDGKIKKFASSKSDGGFAITIPSVTGCRLEVAMMSFAKQSIPLDSVSFPLTVYMEPGITLLKEVTVKADRIREQGDTITYNVGSFSQQQDRSIGDVLRRMPGIDVANNGKIQYQGEDINKFYIEGSDLLGGKYGIATNGISHEDVGAVEVMENHQPMQVLSGISFSDKAAINLKLKNKAKATWTFHGDAGGGWSWQHEGAIWDGELFAMAVMPGFQNITTMRTNNTGENLASSSTDFFENRRQTGLSQYVGVGLPGLTENVVSTNYLTVYATPKFEYWVRRVNLSLNLPLSYSHYTFDEAIANRDEVYFSPSLSFNWKPNNRFSGTLRGGLGRSPMNLNLIHPGLIMTNYRTLKSGVDDFYNSSSQNVSASVNYKHTRHGLFANGMVMHSWSHVPYTMVQQLYGDYVVYSYTDAKNDAKTLMAMGNIGKTLDFMRGSCNVNGSFSRSESHLFSQKQSVNSVSTGWSVRGKINGNPCRWFSFDYRLDYSDSRLTMNGQSESWLSTMENELSLTFIPHRKWQWTVSGEHYRNELTEHNYKNIVMLDTKLTFQLNKKIEIDASLTNIFNKRSYNYTTYSQLSSFESQRQLRGRQLLLSLTIR